MIDKEIIKKNFSKYAAYYDRYSNIQDLCASRLIDKVRHNVFDRILDIGCGTGNYTKLLREKFPSSRIKAIDISSEMIDAARRKLKGDAIEFAIADGERISSEEQFDLISSNASLQWFENLEKALTGYEAILRVKGIILFSLFGPLTFQELNKSLKALSGKDSKISSCNFFKKKRIEEVLNRLFNEVEVEEMVYKETYNTLPELLKKIKYTGARGNGVENKNFWTSKNVNELERIYKKGYGSIMATYQVFFCKGAKS